MIWIKPDMTFTLENEYGGIYWEYETNNVYGVDAKGVGTVRRVRLISDQSEEIAQRLYFPADVSDDREILAADFFSGVIGVLIMRRVSVGSYWKMVPTIHWYDRGHTQPSAYNNLYNNAINFARVPRSGGTFIYQYSDADGTIARWDSVWSSDETPYKYHQMCPWRGQYGQARAFALQDFGAIEVPRKYLVVASPTGAIRWTDLEVWSAQQKILPIYKEVGILKCQQLTDIALDRRNNVLWVLDGRSKLHLVVLEPFGTEEADYTNTPKALRLTPELRVVDPGQEISVEGQLLDMWGQPVAIPDKEVQFISSGLGEFYIGGDGEDEEWGITVTMNTDSDGIAQAVYRGSDSNS